MVNHFLLVFDHDEGKLVEIVEFGSDGDRAVAAYASRESEIQALSGLKGDSRIEVVLIGSDSIATVRLTHANYFEGNANSKYFNLAAVG